MKIEWLLLGGFVVTLVGVVVGFFVALARADKRKIAAYAVERGWQVKRVTCYPNYLVRDGRRRHSRAYFRAVFDCGSGAERTQWFESTFGTDPGPIEKPDRW